MGRESSRLFRRGEPRRNVSVVLLSQSYSPLSLPDLCPTLKFFLTSRYVLLSLFTILRRLFYDEKKTRICISLKRMV